MFETLARLLFDLIQPTSQLMILMLAGVGFLIAGWHVWAKRILVALIVLVLLYTTPILHGLLIDPLENRWPVLAGEELAALQAHHQATSTQADHRDPVYVIVLGSGHTPDPRLEPGQMLTPKVTMRLTEALRVHRMLPESRLVTSAPAPTRSHSSYTQAEALRDAAIALGADPDRIHIQPDPNSTCEEARAFVRDHGPGTRVVIATTATHMRRAMMIFEQQGALPVAAPTNFVRKKDPDRPILIRDYLPSAENIDALEHTIKEYAGYVWDRWQCR